VLALTSPAELDQAKTHIARKRCDIATGAGGLASDNSKGSNKGPSLWTIVPFCSLQEILLSRNSYGNIDIGEKNNQRTFDMNLVIVKYNGRSGS
jgi:hypothetical protein